MKLAQIKSLRPGALAILACTAMAVLLSGLAWGQNKATLAKVKLNADNLGPRQIEDLTSQSVPRDYALAWKTMNQALDKRRADILDNYFIGFEKDSLTRQVQQEQRTGIHIRYSDLGHELDAIFYSPGGDLMQLRDHAQLEMQVMDGDKVIHRERIRMQYVVLMTPGADRWLVRYLQAVPEAQP